MSEAFGNGHYRWEVITGSVFTHVLTCVNPQEPDFGKRWMVHATGVKFPVKETGEAISWFPASYNPRTLEVIR